MLSGYRLSGHIKTSQGGHALTNKLLVKFFSNSSNWTLVSGDILEKKDEPKEILKKTVSANI